RPRERHQYQTKTLQACLQEFPRQTNAPYEFRNTTNLQMGTWKKLGRKQVCKRSLFQVLDRLGGNQSRCIRLICLTRSHPGEKTLLEERSEPTSRDTHPR